MSEITIFAKQRKTTEGRAFYAYVATLPRKDGTNQTVGVKFRGDHQPRPESCPCIINVNKTDMNLSTRDITLKNGDPGKSYTLWVSAWTPGRPYVDHSLDDFDI